MEPTIITWNVPNFITVSLMILLGVLLVMFGSKAYQSTQAGMRAAA